MPSPNRTQRTQDTRRSSSSSHQQPQKQETKWTHSYPYQLCHKLPIPLQGPLSYSEWNWFIKPEAGREPIHNHTKPSRTAPDHDHPRNSPETPRTPPKHMRSSPGPLQNHHTLYNHHHDPLHAFLTSVSAISALTRPYVLHPSSIINHRWENLQLFASFFTALKICLHNTRCQLELRHRGHGKSSWMRS